MKRINFSNYIKQLPSNIILEYLSGENSSRILTNGVYDEISTKFFQKEYISQKLSVLSQEIKDEIFQIYLRGDFGKKISSHLKAEIFKTFLVFEGIEENADVFFGFPDLADVLVENFAENLLLHKETDHSQLFFGTFLSDFAIILDMFASGESKICTNGLYSQRWTDLLKERCGAGKLFNTNDDLRKILDFVIDFSKLCGAKFLTEDGKITLLSNIDKLLEKVMEETEKNLPKIINTLSKTIDFSFLRSLIGDNETYAKFNENSVRQILSDIDFSLKIFHWCGLVVLCENSFKIKERANLHFENGHISPDFSVYIPIEVNPLQLNKILYSTKITSVDVIYHGKIDKKRVEDALVKGISEKEITDVLHVWKIPQSIEKTIFEWVHSFKRAFEDLPYIAFRNDVSPSIAGHPELKEILTPIEGYTFFKVKTGEEKNTFETLERFGFDLRKSGEKNELALEKSEEKSEENKFNKNPRLLTKTQEYILVGD